MNTSNKPDDILEDPSLSVTQFRAHQAFVQAHLKGTLNDEQPLLPAFFPPSSYWTSHEKDLFFHGLAVYSRFRPDLIAESIQSKNTLDVCLYLDILQTASSSIPLQIHEPSFRSSLEPAMEVSSRWIQNEEQIAAALIQFDSCTWTPRSTDDETKSENRCTCSPTSLHLLDSESSPVDHSDQTELQKSYLNHLDCTCLTALQRIVREAQIGKVDSMTVSPSPTPESFGPPATQTYSPTKKANLGSTESPGTASSITMVSKKPDSSKSAALRQLEKRIYMRRMRAQTEGKSINTEAIRLCPGRKTRDKKPRPRPKTYKTRRKIALFSSRKERARKSEAVANLEANRVVSAPTPVDELDQEHEPRSKGGLNKLRRMKNRFLKIGVNSQLASNNNLDIFNLSSLAQLMRLFNSLNDQTRPLNEVSISADTIQLLVVILTEFISEVVRGALISKEQEILLKGTSKVWKYDQETITAENVRETLKSMGIASSKLDFSELVGESNDDISSPDPFIGTQMETGGDDDGRSDDDNQDNDHSETSNEDTGVGPSNASDVSEQSAEPSEARTDFWLPESLRRCLLPKDIRESGKNDDLLPEIDGIELERELKEEEELDAQDLLASEKFEAGLWGS